MSKNMISVFLVVFWTGVPTVKVPLFLSQTIFLLLFFLSSRSHSETFILGVSLTHRTTGGATGTKNLGGTVIFRDPDFLLLNWYHNDFDLDFLEKYEEFLQFFWGNIPSTKTRNPESELLTRSNKKVRAKTNPRVNSLQGVGVQVYWFCRFE